MAVLVGIDEAGLGPILGPLVVSSSTFQMPDHLLKSDLWQILRKSLGNKRSRLAGRLLITDSKKAYNKRLGIKHLQRTTLSCLKCLGQTPTTLTELIHILSPSTLERLDDYPWYKQTDSFNISADQTDLAIASGVLADDLTSNDIELLSLDSCCLDVAYYNKMVTAVKNKASVLFTATCQLMKKACDDFCDDDLQIIVDRQGGRVRYRKNLQRMFPDMEMQIITESPAMSSYELQQRNRRIRLHFVVGADIRFMPVSLASMVSKFLRELLIDNINRYFTAHHAALKPTAGYWQDGLRFIVDLKEHIPSVTYDDNQLIRCR